MTTFTIPRETEQGVLTRGDRWGYSGVVWVISFRIHNVPREILRGVIVPPKDIMTTDGLALWDEQERLLNMPSALCTGFVLIHPIPIPPGIGTYLVWGTGAGTIPTASLYTRGTLL
ncbi:hypothetical protein EV192_111173 [Actinocrispum wychmicini]|uniref:Uncharacterized protein n=1 Tax=Actinocrispum wychmicini TaxID=1213861 RepID=A0A4R2JAI6_9PSEU|nr:hypothetical protein EV192_111173 [Actinocrispum wychmicini]